MFRIFSILFCFTIGLFLHAQKEIAPELLTIENGLSQSFVSSLIQDQEGFIWMGTKNGLNRFDGRNFEIHTKHLKDKNSLIHEAILAMYDDDGFIVIGTMGGLSIYQKSTKKFYEVKLPNFQNTDLKPKVLEVIKDPLGNYWLSEIETSSLYQLKFKKSFFNTIHSSTLDDNSWTVEKINIKDNFFPNYICIYNNKLVFLAGYNVQENVRYTFCELDLETKDIKRLDNSLLPKTLGTFWFKTYKDMLLFSIWGDHILYILNNNKWQALKTDFPIATFSPLENVGKIMIDSYVLKESLFFDETILYKKEIKRTDATSVISGLKIHNNDVLVDKSGVTWIATAGNGVLKIAPRELDIETLFTGKSIYAKPFIYNDKDIFIDNPTTHERLYIKKSKIEDNRINVLVGNKHNCFFTIDNNNTIWGLIWHSGVYSFGQVNEEGQLEKEQELSKSHTVITPVIKYNPLKHEILIAVDALLFIYDIESENMSSFNLQNELGLYGILDIVMTANGVYWLGTTKGLVECDFTGGQKNKIKLWNDKMDC